MSHRILLGVVVAIFLLLVTGSANASTLAPNQLLKLPSGHVAKILSVSQIEYAKGVVALMVRYQTTLTMEEPKPVSEEADEVWKFAQKDVERAGLAEAIISPTHTVKGLLLTTSREANFIFEKGPDGKWTRLTRSDYMAAE
jgi:hypothetical protein